MHNIPNVQVNFAHEPSEYRKVISFKKLNALKWKTKNLYFHIILLF